MKFGERIMLDRIYKTPAVARVIKNFKQKLLA
ncbi:hypothetical protein SAMN04487865_102919 [Succinivibrio dextrinosolvens]|uniref:Uncharacterized protein n=1 Tax=Succinivibrio dextrinosolvens TaxID=83771 RepID=A0A662Z9M3_9GAMM|nr:hypothetical protein SAMN04487865_102919 [Succinivibrio dextrinosolvens]